ncbi:transposase [Coleofasciculus sp. FACHB-1120]|uniref:transposase n=1 Tax=Coleofasciculus sp. FACHB-1120 TaxID=2692783 RepID=UPI0016884AB7|nr:transposase [Coleofasciculus sp. FACHB-1120]MBD2741008.1 transposase [Coleofasciculus sp. FACHB-1120]
MSVRKLSELDKRDILNLYRQPGETTSTLASRYDVSNSTISRLLKTRLSEQEYEALIQQKRTNRSHSISEPVTEADEEPVETSLTTSTENEEFFLGIQESFAESEESLNASPSAPRRRRRSSVPTEEEKAQEPENIPVEIFSGIDSSMPLFQVAVDAVPSNSPNLLDKNYSTEASVIQEMLGEDLTDLEDDEDGEDDEEDDDLEDLEDEDDWEDDTATLESPIPAGTFKRANRASVQVLPLSNAVLPKTCYLVVDRAAELIARPMREFSDLGQIPAQEVQQRTLPVFDNHRVARRFSNRTQRVIKVPDGRMLQKTCSQLQAKGITRLLIDGQVYSL